MLVLGGHRHQLAQEAEGDGRNTALIELDLVRRRAVAEAGEGLDELGEGVLHDGAQLLQHGRIAAAQQGLRESCDTPCGLGWGAG